MRTKATKTTKPKTTATKATKAAPAKKTAAKKATKAAKPKAAKTAAEANAAAVTAYADAYRAWWHSSAVKAAKADTVGPKLAARIELCTLAGCANPGPGHKLAGCEIKTEITALMGAAQCACFPAFYADRTAETVAALTKRLTRLNP